MKRTRRSKVTNSSVVHRALDESQIAVALLAVCPSYYLHLARTIRDVIMDQRCGNFDRPGNQRLDQAKVTTKHRNSNKTHGVIVLLLTQAIGGSCREKMR